jgi:hypothetical protein
VRQLQRVQDQAAKELTRLKDAAERQERTLKAKAEQARLEKEAAVLEKERALKAAELEKAKQGELSTNALAVLKPPDYWTKADKLDYTRVQLRAIADTSAEYKQCVTAFRKTMPNAHISSLKVSARCESAYVQHARMFIWVVHACSGSKTCPCGSPLRRNGSRCRCGPKPKASGAPTTNTCSFSTAHPAM